MEVGSKPMEAASRPHHLAPNSSDRSSQWELQCFEELGVLDGDLAPHKVHDDVQEQDFPSINRSLARERILLKTDLQQGENPRAWTRVNSKFAARQGLRAPCGPLDGPENTDFTALSPLLLSYKFIILNYNFFYG